MAFGPPLVIGEEFAHLEGVESIHIYGSWASRYDGTTGPTPYDVGVLVIGTPNRDAVYDAARRSQERLGREVNVTQRTTEQWESASDDFSQQLRASPMVDVPYPSRDAEKEQGQRSHRAPTRRSPPRTHSRWRRHRRQGLRPTSSGGHIVIVDAMTA